MTYKPGKSGVAIKAALILLALLMLALLLPVCGCAQTITGKAVGVSDGDTLNGPQLSLTILRHRIWRPKRQNCGGNDEAVHTRPVKFKVIE